MPGPLNGDLTVARETASRMFNQFVRQLKSCRECGGEAGFFDTICRHCGAGHPVKIPISAGVLATAIAAQILIVFLRVM